MILPSSIPSSFNSINHSLIKQSIHRSISQANVYLINCFVILNRLPCVVLSTKFKNFEQGTLLSRPLNKHRFFLPVYPLSVVLFWGGWGWFLQVRGGVNFIQQTKGETVKRFYVLREKTESVVCLPSLSTRLRC